MTDLAMILMSLSEFVVLAVSFGAKVLIIWIVAHMRIPTALVQPKRLLWIRPVVAE